MYVSWPMFNILTIFKLLNSFLNQGQAGAGSCWKQLIGTSTGSPTPGLIFAIVISQPNTDKAKFKIMVVLGRYSSVDRT